MNFKITTGYVHSAFLSLRVSKTLKKFFFNREKYQLPLGLRDYCAHLAVPFMDCQRKHRPFATHYCAGLRHDWAHCQYKVCFLY